MINFFTRLFRKDSPTTQEWRLVQTYENTWVTKNRHTGEVDDRGTVYYHLYENESGRRKVAVNACAGSAAMMHSVTAANYHQILSEGDKKDFTFRRSAGCWAITNEDWNKKIYPWLAGRYDPDIPTYESIPRKEFRDNLAGKKL
jgi:hypothetical protein